LTFHFSTLYPYNGHFFAISAKDRTLSYRPETKVVVDIYSAYCLFKRNPKQTLNAINSMVQSICAAWNTKYSSKQVYIGHFVAFLVSLKKTLQASIVIVDALYFRTTRTDRTSQDFAQFPNTTFQASTVNLPRSCSRLRIGTSTKRRARLTKICSARPRIAKYR